MKILFISPEQGISSKNATPVPPSALLYIAGLTPRKHQVELLDLTYDKIDFNKKPDIVALSVMTLMAPISYEVADIYRKNGVKVVIGGHHPTAKPLEVKEHADIVMMGEAEYTWEKFLDDFEKGSHYDFYIGGNAGTFTGHELSGKVFRDERKPDLKNLPYMRRELLTNKYIFDVIFTTRGCPYNCDFCSVTQFFGPKLRHRPVEEVLAEMEETKNMLYISDDNCFFPYDYYSKLYDGMINRFGNRKKWYAQGSLSITKEKNGDILLEKAAKSGMLSVFIGLESVNPKSLIGANAYAKMGLSKSKVDLEETRKSIKRIQSHGIMVWAFLIIGFLEDTKETISETMKFLDETGVLPLPIALSPLPGTKLEQKYADIMLPDRTWDMWDGGHALFQHPNFTPREFEEEVNKLRIQMYSTPRILKRIFSNKLSRIPLNIGVELGMKKSFKDIYEKVKIDGFVNA